MIVVIWHNRVIWFKWNLSDNNGSSNNMKHDQVI